MGSGPGAVEAYRRWRASVLLDDIDWSTFRLLPLLSETARRHGIEDPDAKRIEGAAKHIWLSNTFRLNSITTALEVLQTAAIPSLLLKGAALFARDERQIGWRATGDYDLLVHDPDKRRAIAALISAGFVPAIFRADRFTDADFEFLHAAPFNWGEKAQRGQIDLHWRPSGDFPMPGFSELLFARAERAKLGKLEVLVPCLADHVFLGLVHMTMSRGVERVDWFVEAAQILRTNSQSFDWERLAFLCRRYDLNRVAAAGLATLNDYVPGLVPVEQLRALTARPSLFERIDTHFRVGEASSAFHRLASRALHRIRSQRGGRSLGATIAAMLLSRAAWIEAITAVVCELPDRYTRLQLRWLRRLYRRPHEREISSASHVEFPVGWSAPEEAGRWSAERFLIVRAGVRSGDKTEVQVRLRVRAFIPDTASRIQVALFAGARGQELSLGAESNWPSVIAVPAAVAADRSVTIAIKVFNPRAPAQLGLSDDPRTLGIFVEAVEVAED